MLHLVERRNGRQVERGLRPIQIPRRAADGIDDVCLHLRRHLAAGKRSVDRVHQLRWIPGQTDEVPVLGCDTEPFCFRSQNRKIGRVVVICVPTT